MSEIVYRALPIVASLALLIYLFVLLRSHRIRERYVYLWVALGVGLFVLSVWPQAAFWLTDWMGFRTPANMLLTACSFLLLMGAISLSTTVSGLEEDRRRLVEEIALLDARVRKLESGRHSSRSATQEDSPEDQG